MTPYGYYPIPSCNSTYLRSNSKIRILDFADESSELTIDIDTANEFDETIEKMMSEQGISYWCNFKHIPYYFSYDCIQLSLNSNTNRCTRSFKDVL